MSLSRATRSELTKQFSTSLWWILIIVLVAWVGSTAAGLAAVFAADASGALGGAAQGPQLPVELIPAMVYSIATAVGYVFPLLIGALLVTGEFRHQTLTPTFLATPRRGVALAGKIVAGIVIGLLFAAVAVASTVGPGAGILAAFDVDTQLQDADTWAMIGRMVIAFPLWVLIGIGVGTLVRSQVGAVVGVIAFTQFIEPILRVVAGLVDGLDAATQYLPGAASDALVGASIYTGMVGADTTSLDWWAGGLVLLVYAVAFLVLGYLLSWRRDVS